MQNKVKRHFIAGAICPQCKKFDTIQLTYEPEERIDCIRCGYSEKKSTMLNQKKDHE